MKKPIFPGAGKRCRRLSPGLGWQCELDAGHAKGKPLSFHRAAHSRWTNAEGTKMPKPRGYVATPPLLDEPQTFTWTQANPTATDVSDIPTADAKRQLTEWWIQAAEDEIALTVPKAIEYGSTDLIDIGLMLARTMRRTVNEEEAAELGVFFYLIGKIARWQSAIERGERPSDDTLLDIGVYVRMAQRIRDAGGWPGTESPTEQGSIFHAMCNPHDPCSASCDAPPTHPNRSQG